MNSTARFQPQTLLSEQGEIKTLLARDPLTGLPVLMYQFPGKPRLHLGDLESENIPGILATNFENKRGGIVAAYSSGYERLRAPVRNVWPLLRESMRALRDAARAGVVHGDIRPERFLVADTHLLLEGYGVPWRSEPSDYRPPELSYGSGEESLPGDIYAWAKSVLTLTEGGVPEALRETITRCLADDPAARPDAETLYKEIVEAEKGEVLSAGAPTSPATAAPGDSFERGFEADDTSGEAFAEPEVAPVSKLELPDSFDDDFDPALLPKNRTGSPSPGGLTHRGEGKRDEQGGPVFVKSPPPGATYHSGEERQAPPPTPQDFSEMFASDEPRGGRVRWLLVGGLLLALGVLLYLVFFQQDETPVSQSSTSYIIDVNIVPESLRNVTLLVAESPPGSSHVPGSTITYVPGPALLDRAGEWQLQARFQDRLSEPVTLRVPDDCASPNTCSVTLTLPEAAPRVPR